jgi:hypothetical protein
LVSRPGAGRATNGARSRFWNLERETAAAFGKGAGKQSFFVFAKARVAPPRGQMACSTFDPPPPLGGVAKCYSAFRC